MKILKINFVTRKQFKKKWGVAPHPESVKDGKMLCFNCLENFATDMAPDGTLINCITCKGRMADEVKERLKVNSKKKFKDEAPQEIKDARIEYFNSLLQPRRLGEPSKEFIEAFPKRAEETFTEDEIKSATYVWKDLPGWDKRAKSK